MKTHPRSLIVVKTFALITFAAALASPMCAQTVTASNSNPIPVKPVANPCARFKAGSVIHQPPALFANNGVLNVRFSYQTTTDPVGRQLFCFMTDTGLEDPTLHVNPGDTLNITITNNTPASPVEEPFAAPNCGNNSMTGTSVNIHYHGTNTTPACHGDNVVKTLINSGSTFQYSLAFPKDEPPGLYWYHPHVHGIAEAALLGGAAGALVVDGIHNVQPAVQGLRNRALVIRDQPTIQGLAEGAGGDPNGVPFQDLTVNYIPLDATTDANGKTTYTPAILHMETGETQFWRVCNCTSDSILDLQVQFDGTPQTLQVVGEDAVPVNSQDGTQAGHLIPVTHFRLPPAARVEFLVKAPPSSVKLAQLVTLNIPTGPVGDDAPNRPIFNIQVVGDTDADEPLADDRVANFTALNTNQQRFGGLDNAKITATRTVQFSENDDQTQFFITVAGQTPLAFDNNNPPSIVTTQGSVEKWVIQNLAQENHEFHFHQIHFKVLSQDNFEANGSQQAPGINGQFLDMVEVPHFDNVANPNGPPPSVTVLMDFRGPDVGDFVYHCHILGHEDLGMMAIIRVLPATSKNTEPAEKKDAPATATITSPSPVVSTGGGGRM